MGHSLILDSGTPLDILTSSFIYVWFYYDFGLLQNVRGIVKHVQARVAVIAKPAYTDTTLQGVGAMVKHHEKHEKS